MLRTFYSNWSQWKVYCVGLSTVSTFELDHRNAFPSIERGLCASEWLHWFHVKPHIRWGFATCEYRAHVVSAKKNKSMDLRTEWTAIGCHGQFSCHCSCSWVAGNRAAVTKFAELMVRSKSDEIYGYFRVGSKKCAIASLKYCPNRYWFCFPSWDKKKKAEIKQSGVSHEFIEISHGILIEFQDSWSILSQLANTFRINIVRIIWVWFPDGSITMPKQLEFK